MADTLSEAEENSSEEEVETIYKHRSSQAELRRSFSGKIKKKYEIFMNSSISTGKIKY